MGSPSKKRTLDQISNVEGGSAKKNEEADASKKLKVDATLPDLSKKKPAAEGEAAEKADKAEESATKAKPEAVNPE